jgi:hypothetical protein
MQDRQYERGGLAASCHRAGEHVPPFERGGYGFSLNRGWSLEAELFQSFVKARVKLQ